MLNLILHITVPAGIRLQNNQTLQNPVTFDILSACDPFYASVDQVKLSGGPLLRNLQDITIACAIYNQSQQCDNLLLHKPTGTSDNALRFASAQNQWVQASTARQLLLMATSGGAGGPASHVLANMSVSRQKGFESEGTPSLLKDLRAQMSLYETTLRSGGRAAPGGHVKPTMAAKGVMDWAERTPGRNWIVTGMGANGSGGGGEGSSGGRGKSVHFFANPMFGGFMMGYRSGVWQTNYALPILAFGGSGYNGIESFGEALGGYGDYVPEQPSIITPPPTVVPTDETATAIFAEQVSAFMAVSIQQTGAAVAAHSSNPARVAIGIAPSGVLQSATGTIQTTGSITNSAWNWTLGQPIYFTETGTLSQTPPTTGLIQSVAYPTSPTSLFVEVSEPIIFG